MKWPIGFVITLLSHITRQRRLISMLSNRTVVIALAPKLSTLKQLLDSWHLPENFSGCNALYSLRHFFRAIPWRRLHQKMQVFLIHPNLQKLALITHRYLQINNPNHSFNLSVKDHSPVFGWTNNVINQDRNVVSLVYVFAHPP